MLQVTLIGNIGADAKFQSVNGNEFTSFRVAHTERWTDKTGGVHESTMWVDCVMSDKPKVIEFLKKGQQVFVQGSCKLRVYSSEKDKCMKAGMQISVNRVELLGGKADEIPSRLVTMDGSAFYDVKKAYYIPELIKDEDDGKSTELVSKSGKHFLVSPGGEVSELLMPES